MNAKLLSSVLVVAMGVGICNSARADDEAAPASAPAPAPEAEQPSHGKPGLLATGILLSLLGGGHIALGGAAFAAASHCSSSMWCFTSLDNAVGGISVAIGAALMAVGIPLIVYGATATNRPHAEVGVSPTGLTFSGTF